MHLVSDKIGKKDILTQNKNAQIKLSFSVKTRAFLIHKNKGVDFMPWWGWFFSLITYSI